MRTISRVNSTDVETSRYIKRKGLTSGKETRTLRLEKCTKRIKNVVSFVSELYGIEKPFRCFLLRMQKLKPSDLLVVLRIKFKDVGRGSVTIVEEVTNTIPSPRPITAKNVTLKLI